VAESAITYIDAMIDRRPIYFTVFLPQLGEYFQVEQIGDALYRLRRK